MEFESILSYGAVGDGKTDNSAAFKSALSGGKSISVQFSVHSPLFMHTRSTFLHTFAPSFMQKTCFLSHVASGFFCLLTSPPS